MVLLLPYFLTSLGTTAAVTSLQTCQYCKLYSTTIELLGGAHYLPPPPFITISFAIQNWFSIFQLISHWVTALRPFYIKSSILQFSVLATKSIASWLVRKGHNSIMYFGVCLGQLYSHLRLSTRIPTQQSQSFSPIIPVLKSVAIILFAFVRPSQSLKVFTPYGVNHTTAWVSLALVSLYTFNSYTPLQRQSNQYYITVDGFLAFFYTLLWLLSLFYYYLCWPLTRLPSFSIQAWALKQHYSSFAFFTYFSNIFSLLQGYWFVLLWGTLGSLYSLFRRILIYFITLELRLFCALCIIATLIYSCRGGILASFLSSAVAVRLYAPVILQRQAIWTFQSGLRSNLGGPFLDSLMAQILDLYVMVGRITAVYSRRDLQKYRPYIELTILDNTMYYTWPLQAACAIYILYRSLLFTYTPNTLRP